MLTGLLGNLSLLSYFAKKRETEAVLIQTLGVISTYVVIAQLWMAGAMPSPQFVATSAVVATGLVLNFLNYFAWLNDRVWLLWEDFITVGGLSVLPQVSFPRFHSVSVGSVSLIHLASSSSSCFKSAMSLQVMWSTFVPFIPNSILPGIISSAIAVVAVVMVCRVIPFSCAGCHFNV